MKSISIPKINSSFEIPYPEFNKLKLANQAELYLIKSGTAGALKLELTFLAGRPFEKKRGVASATLQMLKVGTAKKTATKLADGFDHWGSSISFDFYVDTCGIKIFVLEKYLAHILPLICDILENAAFPQSEINLYKRQQKEKLKVDEARGDSTAYRCFTEKLFGKDHPYGYNSTEESIDAIQREDLIDHYNQHYGMAHCKIYLSGLFSDQTATLLSNTLGCLQKKSKKVSRINSLITEASSITFLTKPNTVQSSIRIGRRLFARTNPEYEALFLLNAVLGGFYGSRLMQNLREKRGLTYHIYSSLDTFMYGGYLLISTEVDKTKTTQAIQLILSELKKLRESKIPEKEINVLKNYLKGSFLNYFENPFSQSELIRMLSWEGGIESYRRLVDAVLYPDTDQLQALANKYLQENDLWQVVVS